PPALGPGDGNAQRPHRLLRRRNVPGHAGYQRHQPVGRNLGRQRIVHVLSECDGHQCGCKTNTTGQITSTESAPGLTATATLHVEAPPSIAKAFNPSNIALNATTSLTFTITNPAGNPDALTGVAFTDTLRTGLTQATGTSP